MGTSSDYTGGKGGVHTPFKRATTYFAKHGGSDRAKRVLARHVATLGGPASATASAAAGTRSALRLATFGAGLASGGLEPTLENVGLGHLVGSSRFAVLSALVNELAGDGATLEDEAARAAVLEVLERLYPSDLETFEDLETATIDRNGISQLLLDFLAAYIYQRVLPTLAERLTHIPDLSVRKSRDREIREEIRLVVRIDLEGRDPVEIDWQGDEGGSVVADALRYAYDRLELLEE